MHRDSWVLIFVTALSLRALAQQSATQPSLQQVQVPSPASEHPQPGRQPDPTTRRLLTNSSVIRMVQAGVPESAILASIQAGPSKFDLSTDALLALHKAGVDQKILEAMMASANGSVPQAQSDLTVSMESPNTKLGTIKPTHEQSMKILAALKSQPGKLSPVITNPKAAESQAAMIATLQKQKMPLQPGQTMGATNDPTGGQTPPPGTPGAVGTPGTAGSPGGNPAGRQNPGTGGITRAGGATSTRINANATFTAAAAPPTNSPTAKSNLLLQNAKTSIDGCSIQTSGPIIKGLNSQGTYAPAVFTQDPPYNPFWLIGCRFGNTPGRAYLNSASGQKLTDLQISSWSDTLAKVVVPPTLVDVLDQDNVTLVLVSASGQSGQKSGYKFWAARREILLSAIAQSHISLAQITNSAGKPLHAVYSTPYQGLAYSEALQTGVTIPVAQAEGLNADKGMTAGVDRNDWYRFNSGTDVYDFTQLKPGFVVSKFQIDERTIPVCLNEVSVSPFVQDTNYYDDGSWNAQYSISDNKIRVTFAERHCHLYNGTDSSNSTYAMNVWVSGPALSPNSSPWQGGH